MRLRCGKITKREVRRPVRTCVRRITTPRNKNGEQPTSNVGKGTFSAPMMELIPSTASTTVILSMTVAPMILPKGTVLSPITQNHPMTPTPFVVSNIRPFAINFTMLVPGHEQPYGMPMKMMTGLRNNPSTFAITLRMRIHQSLCLVHP